MNYQTRGLTQQQVEEKKAAGLVNNQPSASSQTIGQILKTNCFTFFNLINVILFALVLWVRSPQNGLFMMVVVCNVVIGVFQQIKAKKTLDALNILIEASYQTIRDGSIISLPSNQLVEGDAVILQNGQQIPADGKVLEGYIECNESMLTGESHAKGKNPEDLVYSGSFVVSGEAVFACTQVGNKSYASKLTQEARQYKSTHSELKSSVDRILKAISFIIVPVGLLVFYSQISLAQATTKTAVEKTVAAVIGMIPEGLFLLIGVALAMAVVRLGKQKVLVQEMYGIETLARVDVLCLDKTGTLTQGKMEVVQNEILQEDFDLKGVMQDFACAFPDGNATQMALTRYFGSEKHRTCTQTLAFSSDRKYSAASFAQEGTYYAGALQFLLPNNQTLQKKVADWASHGFRVVLVAHSDQPLSEDKNQLPSDLKPLALVGLRDELRPSTTKTIQYFNDQGVQLRIISGDDANTVSAIAALAGVPDADQKVDASTLKNEEDLANALVKGRIFGRVTPEQKKAMVSILQQQDHVVAMTGDGVNDVPALKKADISIAMASGSDAAKHSANLVLLDSDFSRMPMAVHEGRRVINNISNAASMFLIKTVFSVLLALAVIVFGVQYPYVPIQMTLISAFATGIPTFFLQLEPTFTPVKEHFVRRSFRRAVPLALCITFEILLAMIFMNLGLIRNTFYPTLCVVLTAFTYTLGLLYVYQPLSKYRKQVITIDALCFCLAMFLTRHIVKLYPPVGLEWVIGLVLLALVPCGIAFLQKRNTALWDWLEKKGFLDKKKVA